MSKQSYVYIIHCKDLATIKIGYSDNPFTRLSQLQMGNSLELSLLSIFKGGQKEEAELHKILYANKVRGEWFSVDDALIEELVTYQADVVAEDLGKNDSDFFSLINDAKINQSNLVELGNMTQKLIKDFGTFGINLLLSLDETLNKEQKEKIASFMNNIMENTNHDQH